jgi:hypothetical protein
VNRRRATKVALLLCCLCAVPIAQAAAAEQVKDGGTCVPYPPYNPASNTFSSLGWEHWLYGFNGPAFCHITMSDGLPVQKLSYVLFTGGTNGGNTLTARLCVHSFDLSISCGEASTINGGIYQVNYVLPPNPLPPSPVGAFVWIEFPNNSVSVITTIIPVWNP